MTPGQNNLKGWILDLYADLDLGVIVWLLGEDGKRYKLHEKFPVTFFASGKHEELRGLWKLLAKSDIEANLSRVEKENSAGDVIEVMQIAVQRSALQPRLLHQALRRFPNLEYYDTDIPLALRFSAVHSIFPFAKCQIDVDENGRIIGIQSLDSRWDPDPEPAPFRIMKIKPDTDPAHEPPTSLSLLAGKAEYIIPLSESKVLPNILSLLIDEYDPDFIVTSYGDTWLFPLLFSLSESLGIPFNPNRDKSRPPKLMKEHSYVQYGRVIYRGAQTHLFGRFHIDRHNAMTYGEYGIPGAIKQSRVTGVPIQEMARKSPGAGITAMFMLTSLNRGTIYPHVKQYVEQPKNLLQLDLADNGGLVYKPKPGFYTNVVQIDFSSMYPSIMSLWNVSPETVGVLSSVVKRVPELGIPINQERRGLVSETLEPLLKLRLELKSRLETLDPKSIEYQRIKGESTALKWLLVVCFGYQGYKRFREGRIEAHETITAISRWILLKSKEVAEKMGYMVLHMYVDGIWVRRKDGTRPNQEEIKQLLQRVEQESGLPITVEADYRWISLLTSRINPSDPVPNQYFGELWNGEFKTRGIGSRRHDTPPYVVKAENDALMAMAAVGDPNSTAEMILAVVGLLRDRVKHLSQGDFDVADLVIQINISRELSQYKVKTAAVRAGLQLEMEGRKLRPGQRVRYLYARNPDKVSAWDLAAKSKKKDIDLDRYTDLLIRMGSTLVQAFGVTEQKLRLLVLNNATALNLSELSKLDIGHLSKEQS